MNKERLYGILTWGLVQCGYTVKQCRKTYTFLAERPGRILTVSGGFPSNSAEALSLIDSE